MSRKRSEEWGSFQYSQTHSDAKYFVDVLNSYLHILKIYLCNFLPVISRENYSSTIRTFLKC